jgi:O-antigen ligase
MAGSGCPACKSFPNSCPATMKDYIKHNWQFIVLVILWVVLGIYGGLSYYALIPASLLWLRFQNRTSEIVIGLLIITVLSDHWEEHLQWASKIKDIYLIIMTGFLFLNSRAFSYRNMVVAAFIPYLLWIFVPLFRSPDTYTAFQKTISSVLLYSIAPIWIMKALMEEKEHFLRGIAFAMAGLLVYGLFMALVWPETAFLAGRFRGVTGNPNSLGLICTLFFALIFIIKSHYPSLFKKQEMFLIYSLILISVVLSGSRNTIFAMLIFYLFSRFFKVSYLLGFSALVILAVVYQMLISNLPTIISLLGLEQYMRVENLESGSSRLIAWQFVMQWLKYDYLLGHGVGYEPYFFKTYAPELLIYYRIGNAHNSWLALWLNTGIIGLVLYTAGLLYRFLSLAGKSVYVIPLLYSILFSATFESWLAGVLSPYLLLMLIIITVVSQLEPAEQTTPSLKPVTAPGWQPAARI